VIYDLFDEFEITPKTFRVQHRRPQRHVKKACLTCWLSRTTCRASSMTGVHVLCSRSSSTALTGHEVKTAYENWQQGAGADQRHALGLHLRGITFEEYRGQATDVQADGTLCAASSPPARPHAFPLGTVDTFATYFAPADFNETVNTVGQPLYAKQEPRKFDRGTDLHTQSNPLPMCHRPGVLVKLVMGADESGRTDL
jgi:hypothetical protein